MIQILGKGDISATVIADSISAAGNRMTTFEFVYPRWVIAELNTHRMLSKNSASSRAVPAASMFEQIENDPAMPIHWGENQSGMSAAQELSGLKLEAAQTLWKVASRQALISAKILSDKVGINGHKQWVNRLTENFTRTKTVISGTEWANFFWLRYHPDAQPEFQELARCAHEAMSQSVPTLLEPGEWHLPYVQLKDGQYWIDEETTVDLETAKMISVSCCAQVSYRKLDDSIEKAKKIYSMLNISSTDKPSHASPCEHQATPMLKSSYEDYTNLSHLHESWEDGITHVRKNGSLWSGNLQGWIQERQLISNEAVW